MPRRRSTPSRLRHTAIHGQIAAIDMTWVVQELKMHIDRKNGSGQRGENRPIIRFNNLMIEFYRR